MIFDIVRAWLTHERPRIVLDPIACCAPVRTDVLDEDQAEVLAQSFAALADPIRLRLLSFIAVVRRRRGVRLRPASSRPAARSRRSATT